jgi:hypothetical protein
MSRRFFFDDLLDKKPEEVDVGSTERAAGDGKSIDLPPTIKFKYACKFCELGGLGWFEVQPGVWRLVSRDGLLHTCSKHPRGKKQDTEKDPEVERIANDLEKAPGLDLSQDSFEAQRWTKFLATKRRQELRRKRL